MSDEIRRLAAAVVAAWDDVAGYEPCPTCLRSGVSLITAESDAAMDEAVDALRAALDSGRSGRDGVLTASSGTVTTRGGPGIVIHTTEARTREIPVPVPARCPRCGYGR